MRWTMRRGSKGENFVDVINGMEAPLQNDWQLPTSFCIGLPLLRSLPLYLTFSSNTQTVGLTGRATWFGPILTCSGSSTDTASCQGWLKYFYVIACFYALFSVEGSWANWEVWTSCSTSCGQGTKSRSRVHSAGPPCSGSSTDTESCQGT